MKYFMFLLVLVPFPFVEAMNMSGFDCDQKFLDRRVDAYVSAITCGSEEIQEESIRKDLQFLRLNKGAKSRIVPFNFEDLRGEYGDLTKGNQFIDCCRKVYDGSDDFHKLQLGVLMERVLRLLKLFSGVAEAPFSPTVFD